MLKPELDGSYRLSFLLLPGYSMASLQAAIDPLRLANEITGQSPYNWELLSPDSKEVVASNGLALSAKDYQHSKPGNLFICSGARPWQYSNPALLWWLRMLYKQNTVFGGIDTGSYLLAEAKLLNKGPVSIHWQAAAGFSKRYPQLEISRSQFEIATGCISCAGGFAVSSLMLHMIEQHFSSAVVESIASHLMIPERQPSVSEEDIIQLHEPRLYKVLKLMQISISTPLSSMELADKAHVSVRHLERLFKRHLHTTPANYYLKIRLEHAHQLIHNSPLDIGEIAAVCGFSSSPHFSRTYSRFFGIGPKRDRMDAIVIERPPQSLCQR
ncbi:GlxA family transcriptional regulator [Amphritea sp. HPY]|uniref:GlxA family transcriptional regulator n=1 Tax=Amphritea sp. HPY TaxID=3421652 RepID=UPI003D7CAD68